MGIREGNMIILRLLFLILFIPSFALGATSESVLTDPVITGNKANVKKIGTDAGLQNISLEKGLQVLIDYDGGTNAIYVGSSSPSALSSAATWRIMKLTYDGNNNVTQVQFADQVNTFTKIYDNRAGYDYIP